MQAHAAGRKIRSFGATKEHTWWRGIPGEEHVLKLDPSNYDRAVSQADHPTFIMFYAPWCGYSVNAKRGFAAAAEQMAMEGSPVLFAAVDCDQCDEIRDRYREIKGYPTFVYMVKGVPKQSYTQQRSKEGFCNWLKNTQSLQQ